MKSSLRTLKRTLLLIKERLNGYRDQRKRFYQKLGYRLNLQNPRSFNEKLVWKKLHDRNPLIPITADKYAVREYLGSILDPVEVSSLLIPLLYVTDRPETIPFSTLPDDYIIKATHGSGWNIIVSKHNHSPDREEIVAICQEWLSTPYGQYKHEWGYQNVVRKVVIEKLIRDENDEIPKDYKFFMFHGRCEMVQVDVDRYGDHRRTLYNRDWERLDVTYRYKQGPWIDKPRNYAQMLVLAEKLACDFDFVRIDLYSVDDQIYFGEFTHYPESGMGLFHPVEFDFELGAHWHLEPEYYVSG